MDISSLPTADLKSLLAKIPKEIERRKKKEKAMVLQELEKKAAEHGFSLEELIGESLVKKEQKPTAAKYCHPSNHDMTWSGRGRQPKWVVWYLQSGGSLEQLRA